ncbi:MAG: alternative ribosome rescue aminoacyl-tRNA hydrolase ArfB [Thermodesulfobacteriota bacterium]|jgi:ribosome-associated protein|nr:MAG: alternative ribosome rescue aminoacyl-tRNA hydrolase ArfB [Thermodesulfobacteriota bacterium]
MIRVTDTINLDEKEISEEFVRSSGPGGQNVNKVSTAVQLRFSVAGSDSLPEEVRVRLMKLAGKRVTSEGILVIDAQRFRTQLRNRQDAIQRLVDLIRKAAEKPRVRRKTKPPVGAKERRLETKRMHSRIKQQRRHVFSSDT